MSEFKYFEFKPHGGVYFDKENADIMFQYMDALEAENAKLQEELDLCLRLAPDCDGCEAMLDCDECLRADSSQKERKRLDYENAKLRELVQDMWFWNYEGHMDSKSQEWQMKHINGILDRMRELEIEVDI